MSEKEKLVLCGICNKPIHIDDWGGVSKEDVFFHSNCLEARVKECRFNPERKYSKSLSENERKKLWAIYNGKKKEFKNFEQFCYRIVKTRELLA